MDILRAVRLSSPVIGRDLDASSMVKQGCVLQVADMAVGGLARFWGLYSRFLQGFINRRCAIVWWREQCVLLVHSSWAFIVLIPAQRCDIRGRRGVGLGLPARSQSTGAGFVSRFAITRSGLVLSRLCD